ncbi:MAG: M1 family metallopeptidase [bacterium]|nr:M1 family metallopeptidase [bacterium]
MAKKVTRLYEGFHAEHYDLTLDIDHNGLKFNGSVKIIGKKIGRPSKRLTFHQKDLAIRSVSIIHTTKKNEKKTIDIIRYNKHKAYDELRLHAETLIYPGTYEVEIHFTGDITRPMDGIYPCYFVHNEQKQHLIATQFESHHARQAFPCIDEPEAKATFSLSLTTDNGLTNISNTPASKISEKSGRTITVFEKTPIMSTYLLAFVSGNMKHKESRTGSGTLVRTFATPDNVEHTSFALETAVKCLDFFEDYFGIPYPLAKCDLVALPDFASGAMENWGCITFREQAMLVDKKHTSLTTKQFAALVVAHELAHQWFGNLVTMRWWTDLWLNEGFASWVEYMAIDHLFPKWQLWTQFLVDDREQALKLDALENTHPIEVTVNHPDEIRTIFDAISYSKGASVISMLHDYLGAEDFRAGMRHYLTKYSYKNTVTTDLWQALEDISGKPVKEFMHAWTSLPGFPIVSAEVLNGKLQLEQSRFYLREPLKVDKSVWPVPLLSQEVTQSTLDKQSNSFEISSISPNINSTQNGFYRISYSTELLKEHAKSIKLGTLDVNGRIGILSDSFESAKAGKTSTTAVLELLDAYRNEDNTAVWDIIANGLATVRTVMDSEELRSKMSPYVIELTARQIARLGWTQKDNESHFDTLLRPIVLAMAAVAEEPNTVKECQRLFKAMHEPQDVDPSLTQTATHLQMKRNFDIDPDMRGVVYGTVARHGGTSEFDKLLDMHNTTTNSEERTNIAAALTGFKQADLIERALSNITTDSVRLQDVAYWIAYSFMNRFARDKTWDWIKENWDWLKTNFEGDLGFYRMPVYAARTFSHSGFIKEYKEFFEPKRSPAFNRSIDQGIEIIEWHTAWRKRDFDNILTWFSKN